MKFTTLMLILMAILNQMLIRGQVALLYLNFSDNVPFFSKSSLNVPFLKILNLKQQIYSRALRMSWVELMINGLFDNNFNVMMGHPTWLVLRLGQQYIQTRLSYAYLTDCYDYALRLAVDETIKAIEIMRGTLDAVFEFNKLTK